MFESLAYAAVDMRTVPSLNPNRQDPAHSEVLHQ